MLLFLPWNENPRNFHCHEILWRLYFGVFSLYTLLNGNYFSNKYIFQNRELWITFFQNSNVLASNETRVLDQKLF